MKPVRYHFIALFVVVAWGTTFVATQMLLDNGLSPRDILFYRFLLAYICVWFLGQKRLFASNLKDELMLMLLGITGGSLYFLSANTALELTQSSNVALLACTAPIFIVVVSRLLFGKVEKLSRYFWQGSLLALTGIAFVVFNGYSALEINPLGDMLSLLAALSWAFYTLFLKRLSSRYDTLFITRKVFFYGVLTVLPLFLFTPLNLDTEMLMQPAVWGSLLYLGIIASLMCFFLWNVVVKKIGAVRATNYIYLSPVVTMAAGAIVMGEVITLVMVVGALLILAGVALVERG
jgi:drug/metabolite transporter (DMT)-like permease